MSVEENERERKKNEILAKIAKIDKSPSKELYENLKGVDKQAYKINTEMLEDFRVKQGIELQSILEKAINKQVDEMLDPKNMNGFVKITNSSNEQGYTIDTEKLEKFRVGQATALKMSLEKAINKQVDEMLDPKNMNGFIEPMHNNTVIGTNDKAGKVELLERVAKTMEEGARLQPDLSPLHEDIVGTCISNINEQLNSDTPDFEGITKLEALLSKTMEGYTKKVAEVDNQQEQKAKPPAPAENNDNSPSPFN